MADDGERVDPWLLTGLRRLRRWQHGHTAGYGARHLTLGQMGDGRWLVEDSDTARESRAYLSRERAERQLAELMWDGDWQEVPAVIDARGSADGWVRRGGAWMRDDPAS
ncbi:hypothetical protein [Micromonospora sp. CA-248212]|uniref:hypothetical protein n=1 Tax=Micromonospora sp. CA-248212 TaxID=3239961 RepID=UPI003D9173F5